MSATGDPAGYYRALGVSRTATAEEIRAAFRARAMAAHPDRSAGSETDSEAFRLVRDAYEVLRDPRRRMAYDASSAAASSRRAEAGGQATEPPPAAGEPRAAAAEQPPGNDRSARTDKPPPRERPALVRWPARLHGLVQAYGSIAAAGLALALLVALGALWSAHRQLDDRQALLDDLYGRLALQGEALADTQRRYRALAFLDLERALQRGGRLSGDGVRADSGRAAYLHTVAFAADSTELAPAAADRLDQALVEIARQIEALPPAADWLIVLDAQASRATLADQVAVAAWEPALLRLAVILDHLLAEGLPGERLAVRFAAGFAVPAGNGGDTRAPAAPPAAPDEVLIKLVCCGA
jgi:hypothetical protein